MALNLHKYENQARLSVAMAVVGLVGCVGAVALLVRNFNPADRFVYYGASSMYLPLLGVMLLVSLGGGAIGFFVGISSAGQRRNKAANVAWAGFFLSAAVITLALCAGIFFYFTRNAVG